MTIVVLIGTLDTKGEEYGFLRDRLRGRSGRGLARGRGRARRPEGRAGREPRGGGPRPPGPTSRSWRGPQTGARRSRRWPAGPARCSAAARRGEARRGPRARRLRRHVARDLGHAGAARGDAEADGLDRRLGGHAALRGRVRRHDDVLGRGHRRDKPDLHPHPRQRRGRDRRHGQGRRARGRRGEAPRRRHHVRRHHPGGRGRARAPRSPRLRGPRLPRHRRRRAVHGGPDQGRFHNRRPWTSRRPSSRTTWSAACSPRAPSAWRPPGSSGCPRSSRWAPWTWSTSGRPTRSPTGSRGAPSTSTTRPSP